VPCCDVRIVDPDGSDVPTGLDRIKDVVIRGGYKVYSVELEYLLVSHPRIEQAAVFGVPDKIAYEAVACYITATAGETVTAAEVRTFAHERMAGSVKVSRPRCVGGSWPQRTAAGGRADVRWLLSPAGRGPVALRRGDVVGAHGVPRGVALCPVPSAVGCCRPGGLMHRSGGGAGLLEDVPSSVELRWRPVDRQATLIRSSWQVAPTVSAASRSSTTATATVVVLADAQHLPRGRS